MQSFSVDAIMRLLIELKAENLVLFDRLQQHSLHGRMSRQDETQEKREYLLSLPAVKLAMSGDGSADVDDAISALLQARHP